MNTTWGTLFDLTTGKQSDLALSLVMTLLGREPHHDVVCLEGAQLFAKTRFRYHGRDVAQCLWTTVGDGPEDTSVEMGKRKILELQPIQLERWPKSLDWTGHFDEYTFHFILLPKRDMKKDHIPNWQHNLQKSLRTLRIGWEFRTNWEHEPQPSKSSSKPKQVRAMSASGFAQIEGARGGGACRRPAARCRVQAL